MEVVFTDPFKKDIPYFNRGLVTDYQTSPEGILYREVYSKKDNEKRLIKLNYFHESNPNDPTGWDEFERFWESLDLSEIKTLVFDGYTAWEYLARVKADAMPHAEDDGWFVPRQSKKFIESYLRSFFYGIPCNLAMVGHVSKERINEAKGANDSMITHLFAPAAIGDLKQDIVRLFSETYITRVVKVEGEKRVQLQTEIDNKYYACTQMGMPDSMELTKDTTWKELVETIGVN